MDKYKDKMTKLNETREEIKNNRLDFDKLHLFKTGIYQTKACYWPFPSLFA